MTEHDKLPPKILGIMLATSVATFGVLVVSYRLLF
jgi:hypothetical protein